MLTRAKQWKLLKQLPPVYEQLGRGLNISFLGLFAFSETSNILSLNGSIAKTGDYTEYINNSLYSKNKKNECKDNHLQLKHNAIVRTMLQDILQTC